MKKIKYIVIVFALLYPAICVFAATSQVSVTRDTSGFIRPSIILDYIKANFFSATSTTASSTLQNTEVNNLKVGTLSGLLKSVGGYVTQAVAGTDYQAIGNYITALTGDGTASGPGSSALTLATVNSNVGSFTNANVTADAKGRITAISNGAAAGASIGTVATSSQETAGQIGVFGTTNGYPAKLYSQATTSLAVSSPLTVTGTLGALIGGSNSTINCQTASGSQAGCLSSTDWTTFNGKESPLTFTYPLVRTVNAISSALATTSSNTWGGTQTFTNSPVFSTVGAGTVNSTSGGTLYNTSTSTATISTGLSYSGTWGQSIGGVSGNLTNTGVLSLGDLNHPLTGAVILATSTSATNGITSALTIACVTQTCTFTPSQSGTLTVAGGGTGIGTFTSSQLLYGNGTNALSSVATSSLAVGTGLVSSGTLGAQVGGTASSISFAAIAANSLWVNATGGSAVPTAKATSTLGIALTDTTGLLDVSNRVTGDLAFSNLTQGAALSVLANATNGTADFAALAAASDFQVLRRSGTALAFGSVNLASSNAVTGALGIANAGLGAAFTDPNADQLMFWDDSASSITGIGTLTGASISGTTLTITDSYINNTGDTGTGAYDFGGATSVEIPNGTGPTVDATGEIAIDTTSDQLIGFGATAKKVYGNGSFYPAFTFATTTTMTGTTTIPMGPAYIAETWNGVKCFTDVGTVNVSFYDGTNRMNMFNASTTVGTVVLSTNNTFTAGEKRYVDIGTPASAPTKVSCTVDKSYTAD